LAGGAANIEDRIVSTEQEEASHLHNGSFSIDAERLTNGALYRPLAQ
jgi:hypothetical protein